MPTTRPSAPPGRPVGGLPTAFPPVRALAVAGTALGCFLIATGLLAPTGAVFIALVVGELMLLVVPLLATVRSARAPAALGLVRPAGRHLLAAIAIGVSAWYVNLRLVNLLPLHDGGVRVLEDLVETPPLPVALLAIALVPAVCEEVLFRGLLLRALATRLVPAAAIALTALAFAAYHLSVVQFVPTFTLGLLAGVLAHRAGSVAPAILAHLLNNGIAVLVSRGELPTLERWLTRGPLAGILVCAGLVGVGLALTVTGPPARPPRVR